MYHRISLFRIVRTDTCEWWVRNARLLSMRHSSKPYSVHSARSHRPSLSTLRLPNPLRRILHLPSVCYPPATFLGLFIVLWTYKCLMMVGFQNKIIYMPSVPPFSRSEKIEDYISSCRPIEWREERLVSLDGIELACAVGQSAAGRPGKNQVQPVRRTVIIYFHGNGGSLPPRLPSLSTVLRRLESSYLRETWKPIIVALSYRGYWKSSGRASEAGIRLDSEAVLQSTEQKYPDANIILWGQSLGAAVALHALSTSRSKVVAGLILETPFVSISAMLTALYPQKWLPYRYLGLFLWNSWDAIESLQRLESRPCGKLLILQAGKDELVPHGHADQIAQAAKSQGMEVRTLTVKGALHNDVLGSREGTNPIAAFIEESSTHTSQSV